MSESWSDVFTDLDRPVLGDPLEYDTAETEANDLRIATESCVGEFARINSADGAGELQGQAATQLATLVGEIDGSLSEVPPVFTDLAGIFDRHARDLRDIKVATTGALARARTRWSAVETAKSEHASASSALAGIERQTRQLQIAATADPVAAMELPSVQQREWTARSTARRAASTLEDARADLAASRTEFNQLTTDETDLIDRIVRELGAIDLGELNDPNRLLEIVGGALSWAGGLVADVLVGLYRAVEAVMDGRFLDALWHLSDVIGAVLTILTVVALVVALVASGGLLAAVLPAVMLAGGALKLGFDAILAGTQHPHPTTGQTRTWGEVTISAAFLMLSVVAGGVGGRGSFGNRIAGVGPGGVAGTLPSNLSQVVNPVSAAGRPLFGAARNASTQRAASAAVSGLVDDLVMGPGAAALETEIQSHVGSDALTTDTAAWTHPSIVALASGPAPIVSSTTAPSLEAMLHIETSQFRVGEFPTVGPTSAADAPVFQLADAECGS